VLWTISTDTALTPLKTHMRIFFQGTIVVLCCVLLWFEVQARASSLRVLELPYAGVQIKRAEAGRSQRERGWLACPDHACPRSHDHDQVCTIFCAHLDATALGALLNVLVFCVKQLVHTVVYKRQLLIINTIPRISFDVKMYHERMAADRESATL
jgi:hypothetical protein